MERLGILGGSFDPIHNGHLYMAENARKYCALDEVWLVPSGHSANKREADMAAAEHRFRMCELAAQAGGHTASRIELDSEEKSYTYRTLERLLALVPQKELCFIMGADSLDYFDRWVRPERICELATLLVVPRNPFDERTIKDRIQRLEALFPCEIRIVPCAPVPLSSTVLREKLRSGRAGEQDFPPGVYDYIRQNGLYNLKKE